MGALPRLSLLALVVLLLGGLGAMVGLGLDGQLGLDAVLRHHARLASFVSGEPLLASLLFMGLYAFAVAISIPGVQILAVVGGWLFGWLHGTIYVAVAATIAASAVFLLARSALAQPLRDRAGPAVQRFADGFRDNAPSFVFVLHLVPLLPYAVVNTLPAACGVRLRTFVFGAFLGVLPSTVLLAQFGSGLGDVLARGSGIRLSHLLTPQILLALAGLGALALLPVLYRAWQARRRAGS
ncbi:MAG: TVP38/TMEM64 family protein [Geminicoccaceae bacterium]